MKNPTHEKLASLIREKVKEANELLIERLSVKKEINTLITEAHSHGLFVKIDDMAYPGQLFQIAYIEETVKY
jgi:hypothetical protein